MPKVEQDEVGVWAQISKTQCLHLHIPVDDPVGVDVLQGRQDLARRAATEALGHRRVPLQVAEEFLAPQVLHDDVQHRRRDEAIEVANHIGMWHFALVRELQEAPPVALYAHVHVILEVAIAHLVLWNCLHHARLPRCSVPTAPHSAKRTLADFLNLVIQVGEERGAATPRHPPFHCCCRCRCRCFWKPCLCWLAGQPEGQASQTL
mmetsp:Transcript_137993/g.384910  ORF Transcript_137993/g.384910 Transcript_137993/m.384910 type:complete len:206 (+) Transcript_137993:277-894(+)